MILDTDFLVSLREDNQGALQKAADLEGLPTRIPSIVVWELFSSVGIGDDPIRNQRQYETLLNTHPVVDLDRNTARRAGVLHGRHFASDTLKQLDGGDSVVAATALAMDEPVVSNDTDFQDVEGLRVETF